MAIEDAMAALVEHWDDVASRLTPEQASELRELFRQLAGPDRGRSVDQITDLLIEWLPPRHAVRRALAKTEMFAPPVPDWDALVAVLLDQSPADPAPPGSAPGPGAAARDDAPASVADILRVVTERLLAAPALSEQEVRQRRADPVDPALIRLTRPDGGHQWPVFQFALGNGPLPVVRAINTLLNAAGDPIGVADWWLSRNGWLNGRPSELLGQLPDEVLLSAARAVGSEV